VSENIEKFERRLQADLAPLSQEESLAKRLHELNEEALAQDHVIRTIYQEMERAQQILDSIIAKGKHFMKLYNGARLGCPLIDFSRHLHLVQGLSIQRQLLLIANSSQ